MAKAKSDVVTSNQTGLAELMEKFVVVKDLVLPSLSIANMVENDVIVFTAHSEINYSEQVDEKTGEVKTKKGLDSDGNSVRVPEMLPTIVAVDLNTGERGNLVLPTIPHRGFKNAGALTGRTFAMKKGKSLGVSKATLWEVKELEAK